MRRERFPRRRLQRKPLISDPGMLHSTYGGGENVPGIPGARALSIFKIWQEAHVGTDTPKL